MGSLPGAHGMSAHAETCHCAGRPAVHPRHNSRALRQPCNPWQRSSTRQISRQRTSAHSGAHSLVQASSQPVLAPRCVALVSTCLWVLGSRSQWRVYTHTLSLCSHAHRTQEMGGDPMGMLLRQRIVFLGGEVSVDNKFAETVAADCHLSCGF